MTPTDEASELAARTTAAQGLPLTVTDSSALQAIARLVRDIGAPRSKGADVTRFMYRVDRLKDRPALEAYLCAEERFAARSAREGRP